MDYDYTKNALQVMPHEYHEANVIVWGTYMLSATSQQLISMAMKAAHKVRGKIKGIESTMMSQFSMAEFCAALNIEDSGDKRQRVNEAIDSMASSFITYKDENNEEHRYPWILDASIDGSWTKITIYFNPVLTPHILDLKKNYTRLSLEYIGKLQSRYAIRFYKLALSRSGFAGKNGNKPEEWIVSLIYFDELRKMFEISPDEYKERTNNFKKYVIENPIKEINEGCVGIHIRPEYKRERRRLVGVIFHCRWTNDSPRFDPALPQYHSSTLRDMIEETERKDAEEMKIIASYPEEAAEIRASLDMGPNSNLWSDMAKEKIKDGSVIMELKKRHPDWKANPV
jgi:plasmid replication initiation protein